MFKEKALKYEMACVCLPALCNAKFDIGYYGYTCIMHELSISHVHFMFKLGSMMWCNPAEIIIIKHFFHIKQGVITVI